MRVSNEEIIAAYQETGSVWKAGKKVGLAGQTVHERLQLIGYKLASSAWTEEELAELELLAKSMTIAQIANKLGRPYNGVAIKISRLGLGDRFGNKGSKKPIPRNGLYVKEKIDEYITQIDSEGLSISKFATIHNLEKENLANAFQRHRMEWFIEYAKKHGVGVEAKCEYCESSYWPLSKRQRFCNRKCANHSRTDQSYFGGNRRNTIGFEEKQCQLCGAINPKALSSHHMIGKENDPENKYLIALCSGCHHIVTIVAGRKFAATPEAWEVLIQLVLIRKHGHKPDMKGVYCSVEIEFMNDENAELYESYDDSNWVSPTAN